MSALAYILMMTLVAFAIAINVFGAGLLIYALTQSILATALVATATAWTTTTCMKGILHAS